MGVGHLQIISMLHVAKYVKGLLIQIVIIIVNYSLRDTGYHVTFGRFSVFCKEKRHITRLESCEMEGSARAHATYVTGPPFGLSCFTG
jgi:hypothetical protein